jgi:hypothetical protein
LILQVFSRSPQRNPTHGPSKTYGFDFKGKIARNFLLWFQHQSSRSDFLTELLSLDDLHIVSQGVPSHTHLRAFGVFTQRRASFWRPENHMARQTSERLAESAMFDQATLSAPESSTPVGSKVGSSFLADEGFLPFSVGS